MTAQARPWPRIGCYPNLERRRASPAASRRAWRWGRLPSTPVAAGSDLGTRLGRQLSVDGSNDATGSRRPDIDGPRAFVECRQCVLHLSLGLVDQPTPMENKPPLTLAKGNLPAFRSLPSAARMRTDQKKRRKAHPARRRAARVIVARRSRQFARCDRLRRSACAQSSPAKAVRLGLGLSRHRVHRPEFPCQLPRTVLGCGAR